MNLEELCERIGHVPVHSGRRIIAIAGAPASGKSTLAETLSAQIPRAAVVPMDGFHRDNDDLRRHGLLARKGAPQTFDANGFLYFINTLRDKGDLMYPTFDRSNDCVVPRGAVLGADIETVLVEGNYLLLDHSVWRDLRPHWDLTVMAEVPLDVLRDRLVERWVTHGYDATAARLRANENDIPNARLVIEQSTAADVTVNNEG